jgi:hypothetical protein
MLVSLAGLMQERGPLMRRMRVLFPGGNGRHFGPDHHD